MSLPCGGKFFVFEPVHAIHEFELKINLRMNQTSLRSFRMNEVFFNHTKRQTIFGLSFASLHTWYFLALC